MAGVFTIPAGLPFADLVARHVLDSFAKPDDLLALCRVTILVPNRRAVGTLRDAFLRAGDGRVMLLPAIRSIADGAEETPGLAGIAGVHEMMDMPPPVDRLQRRLHLARLIGEWAVSGGNSGILDPARAFLLSGDLADLIDELHTENIAPNALLQAAPEEFSDRWQVAIGLLTIAIEDWPAEKSRLGICDPSEYRDRMLRTYAEALSADPPEDPVIVAGSTGSVPSTAELLSVIAGLPAGMVILPGLDQELDSVSWKAAGPEHPQSAMKRLLDKYLKLSRSDVRPWPGVSPDERHTSRIKLVSDLLRPAQTTERWQEHEDGEQSSYEGALEGITLIEAPGQREESQIIALALREALEVPGRTAALVTPDRVLAARVAASLRRWEIGIDDSGGTPLGLTPRGVFLLLLVEAAESAFTPVPLLSLLKHPLAAGGLSPGDFRRRARILERAILRGPRPGKGLDGILSALAGKVEYIERVNGPSSRLSMVQDARSFLTRLSTLLAPLSALATDRACLIGEVFFALGEAAENLATTNEEAGAERMWAGHDGNAAFAMMNVFSAQTGEQTLNAGGALQMLRSAMADIPVRAAFDQNPRLHIWGTPEARMQQTDLTILGGLNEGVWPALPKIDIWLNRPMRHRAGLTSPERRIGLAAHDFAQGLAAPEVMLTRSRKVDGAPQVAARWLFRLESLTAGRWGKGHVVKLKSSPLPEWAELLDRPAGKPRPARRPQPTPPVHARPVKLPVTRIETWIRDPYALYARDILKLRPLDPIDQDPSHLERGIIVHKVLERFVERTRDDLPSQFDALKLFTEIVGEELETMAEFPTAQAFWRTRLMRAGEWIVDFEANRRSRYKPLKVEVGGELALRTGKGIFTLTAKADRIDQGAAGLSIIDYKTGSAPSIKMVQCGLSPQLSLEALIAQEGGFSGLEASPVSELVYVELGGGATRGKFKPVADGEAVGDLVAKSREGLRARFENFSNDQTPYPSRLYPQLSQQTLDYDHLARVREWSLAGSGEESE